MSEARVQPGLRLGGRVSVPLTDKPVLQTGLTGRGVGKTRAPQTGITHPSRAVG